MPAIAVPTVCRVLLVLLASIAAGCTSTSSVTTLYQRSAPLAQSLLVTGRLPDPAQRRVWESACVDALEARGRTLVPAHEPLPNWYAGDNEALLHSARAQQIDAVLVVELSALLLSPMQLPPRNDVSEERFTGPPGSQPERWQIRLDGEQAPSPPSTLHFQARLLASDGTTRWEGTVATHEANQITAIARSQCEALSQALHKAHLIP